MTAIYPHRKLWDEQTIKPGAYAAAVDGEWVDYRFWASSGAVFKFDIGTAPATINFTLWTCEDDGTGLPDAANEVQMGNCDICSDSVLFEDGTITIDPAADPYLTDGKVTGYVVICCPQRYVRAKADAAGSYCVDVTGLAKNLARA